MKQRVAEMEREAEKLRELQAAAESASTPEGADGAAQLEDEKTAVDGRSVFVGNVRPIFRHSTVVTDVANIFLGVFACRSITALRRKSFKDISRRVEQSTGLPSFATSSLGIQKGRLRNHATHYISSLTLASL